MANDISYFKVQGDNTQYSFNDADLESRIGAEEMGTTAQSVTGAVAELVGEVGTLSNLTTDEQDNLVGAINEVDAHADTTSAKVNGTAIPSGADLNNYTTVGKYYVDSESIATSLVNKPSDLTGASSMEVVSKGGYVNQIIYQVVASAETIFARTLYSDGWRNWHKISSYSYYTSMADLYNAASGGDYLLFAGSSALYQALTKTTSSVRCYGFAILEPNSGGNVSYIVINALGTSIFCGRLSDASTIARLTKYSGESIV